MTKNAFYREYQAALEQHYPWAQDRDRLAKFLGSVKTTLETDRDSWDHHGECINKAWHAIGGKGKPTLKALRALPQGEA